MEKAKTVDEYISGFPSPIQDVLQSIRLVIIEAAPDGIETINYGIPTIVLNGNLVHFAAYKNHIGFYPGPSGIKAFLNELTGYDLSKGTIKFPLNQPLPLELIKSIVKFRVIENREK